MLINPLITTYLKMRQKLSAEHPEALGPLMHSDCSCEKQLELALRGPVHSKLALREKHREAPTCHHFCRDLAVPEEEAKPFENQMNNEHGMLGISLHDFNNIAGRRLRRFLNVNDEVDDEFELLRKFSGGGLIVTTVTGVTPCFARNSTCDGCDDRDARMRDSQTVLMRNAGKWQYDV